jgi:hypothetical protein
MATRVVQPRDAVIDRFQATINGTSAPDKNRIGYMSRKRAAHTLDLFKASFGNPMTDDQMSDSLRKSVSVATGLTYYDLRAPAMNLFPTVTPIRNSLARMQREHPGEAAHWKAVVNTIGSGQPFMGWVQEGRRSASMSYVTSNKSLSYMTLGEEDSITEEARFAADGFEDEDALVQLRLLLRTFIKEEAGLIGGDNSLPLGTPSAPTLGASGSTATLPAGTYSVIVVALTQEGYLNSSLSGGIAQALTITGNDARTYVLNGGSSNKSPNTTQPITLGQALTGAETPVTGAVAYAWFVGVAGQETLQAITTINSVVFSAPLTSGLQPAAAITADCSTNQSYAFDGLLTWAFNPSSGAYVNTLPTGTAGTGTFLTSSGAGGVNEIDTMNKAMWDNSRLSATVIYVNSQEQKNITAKTLNGASAPLLRYNQEVDAEGGAEYKVTAGGVVSYYFNPYTPDGGVKIPIKIHPNLAAGTLLGWAEHLPPWYVSNAVPECAVVQTRQDYYSEIWPKVSREQYYGCYSQEVLAVYVPFAMGLLTNVGNG